MIIWQSLVDVPDHDRAWTVTGEDGDGNTVMLLIVYDTLEWRALEYNLDVEDIELLLALVLYEYQDGRFGSEASGWDDINPYALSQEDAEAAAWDYVTSRDPLQFAPDQDLGTFAEEVINNHLSNSEAFEFRRGVVRTARAAETSDEKQVILQQAMGLMMRDPSLSIERAEVVVNVEKWARQVEAIRDKIRREQEQRYI